MTNYIIVGTGGHGKVVLGYLERNGIHKKYIAFVDIFEKRSESLQECPVVGDLTNGIESPFDYAEVIIAYGGSAYDGNAERQKAAEIVRTFTDFAFEFATVIDPSAVIVSTSKIDRNVSVGINASVGSDATIHEGVIINNYVNIEHDVKVNPYANLSPNSVLLGGVTIEERVFIGAGAIVRDDITIHRDCVVPMGAVVTEDTSERSLVAGNPAEVIRKL